jgi:hypothetical protein
MNRDVLTTVGGLVLVGVVVVATFLYGNEQRQAQLRHDQTAQRQAQQQQSKNQSAAKTPSTSTNNGGATASSQQPAVQSPGSSNQTALQGGSSSSTASSPVPSAGPAPSETPRTGSSSILYVIGATLMLVFYRVHRRSRLAVVHAALKTVRTRSASL